MSVDADLDNRAEVKFAGFLHFQVALRLPSRAVVSGEVAVHSTHLRGVRCASLLQAGNLYTLAGILHRRLVSSPSNSL